MSVIKFPDNNNDPEKPENYGLFNVLDPTGMLGFLEGLILNFVESLDDDMTVGDALELIPHIPLKALLKEFLP